METTDEDLDALLGAAAETLPEAEEFVDVGLLQAFRADHLDAEEQASVEALLRRSQKARDLLFELGDAPSEAQLNAAIEAASRPSRAWLWAPGLALAAALALWALPSGQSAPAYRLSSVQGRILEVRGPEDAPKKPDAANVLDSNGRLSLVVVPTAKAVEGVRARVFVAAAGALRPVKASVTERKGAFRIEAEARALFGEAEGRHRVHVALGAPERIAELRTGEESGVTWLRVDVEYRLAK